MPRRSGRTLVAVAAIVVAILVWTLYAVVALGGDPRFVKGADVPLFVSFAIAGSAIDAGVAILAIRARARTGSLLWLGLRTLLSGAGFLLFTFPAYAIAAVALATVPPPAEVADPTKPHAFEPRSARWYQAMTPTWWSRNLVGAAQFAAGSACRWCGEPEEAEIHADGGPG